MAEQWITVPRWDEFQHRDAVRVNVPTWIKMYTRLLSDDDYLSLSLAQRGVLHGIWLEYARSRANALAISRLRTLLSASHGEATWFARNLAAIQQAGFIQLHASKPASNHASTNTSTEERREEHPLNPPQTPPAQTRTRNRNGEPTHEDLNPHICGINGCQVRHPTQHRIEEHRENVHGLTPATVTTNSDLAWLDELTPDPNDDTPF